MAEASGTARGLSDAEIERLARARGGLRRHLWALCAGVVLFLVIACAILAGILAPHDPRAPNVLANLLPPSFEPEFGETFLLGTDAIGRDVLSVILYGARLSLAVGVASVLGAGVIGTLIGVFAGYFRGWTEETIMRLVDIQMAFPFILLAIIIMFVLGHGFGNVVAVLIVTTWPMYARVARAETLRLRDSEYVLAARVAGAGSLRIIFRHILPNSLTPIIIIATAAVPQMIILEAALSFLGVGLPPDEPSWGGLLAAGRGYLSQGWWIATFPGIAIMLTVLSINILGDWLRDQLDPNLKDS